HVGAERAAAEAAEASVAGPRPLTADEARAAAAAEGLELVPSSRSETGFKGVRKSGGRYVVMIYENGKPRYIGHLRDTGGGGLVLREACWGRASGGGGGGGNGQRATAAHGGRGQGGRGGRGARACAVVERFATPEEAALCYARHIGAERAAAEAAEASAAAPRLLTADDARAAAVAEGLELVHAPAPSGPNEVELAEALRCWRVLLSALRDDRRKQRAPSLSSPPPPSPDASATTEHASRKRLAAAVA
ncbi:hypothetical protein Ctob_007063, partial [Chrysochromulina tobinii]